MSDLVDPSTPYALIDRALNETANLHQKMIAQRLRGAADALQRRGDLVAALITQHLAEALAREVGMTELRAGGKPLDLPPSSTLAQVRAAAVELMRAVRAAMEEMAPGSTCVSDTAPIWRSSDPHDGFQYDAGDGWVGYVAVVGDAVVEGRWLPPAVGGKGADHRHPIPAKMTATEVAAHLLIAADPKRAALVAFTRAPQMLPVLCALHPPVESRRLPPSERAMSTPESRSTGWCILAVDAAINMTCAARVSYSHLEPALGPTVRGTVRKTTCVIDGRPAWRMAITIPRSTNPSFLARWLATTQPWPQEYIGSEQATMIDVHGVLHTFAFDWCD